MSVRNRELSQYSTPIDVVDAVIQRYFAEHAPFGTILDPCAFDGDAVSRFEPIASEVCTGDIDGELVDKHDLDCQYDFIDRRFCDDVDWIVTNPPYSTPNYHATDFVEKALGVADDGVAMLLRASFLEPCQHGGGSRVELMQDRPPTHIFHMYPRISFTGDGATDSQHHVWCIWRRCAPFNGVPSETQSVQWVDWTDPLRGE